MRRFASKAVSGCFISAFVDEDRYPSFVLGSAFIRFFSALAGSFRRTMCRHLDSSLIWPMVTSNIAAGCNIDWESAKRESWFLGGLYRG